MKCRNWDDVKGPADEGYDTDGFGSVRSYPDVPQEAHEASVVALKALRERYPKINFKLEVWIPDEPIPFG